MMWKRHIFNASRVPLAPTFRHKKKKQVVRESPPSIGVLPFWDKPTCCWFIYKWYKWYQWYINDINIQLVSMIPIPFYLHHLLSPLIKNTWRRLQWWRNWKAWNVKQRLDVWSGNAPAATWPTQRCGWKGTCNVYPLVNIQKAIENDHLVRGFSH
jgi:hypothetical protein